MVARAILASAGVKPGPLENYLICLRSKRRPKQPAVDGENLKRWALGA
jgi:hypothetical protein